MVFFAAPPEDFGPVNAALSTLRRDTEIPKGSWAYRWLNWGQGPDFEAYTGFLGRDALTWATWRPGSEVEIRTLRFENVKEIRFEAIDEYERLLREQPTRVTVKHFQARVHSFGLIWVGLDGDCLLGHHLVLETAAPGLKAFLDAAMEAWTHHLLARLHTRRVHEGFAQVGLGHTGWIRLYPAHLDLKDDVGPIHTLAYPRIRAVRLWQQQRWILEVDDPPETEPFCGKAFETDAVRVANLAFLMQALEPHLVADAAKARQRQRQIQRKTLKHPALPPRRLGKGASPAPEASEIPASNAALPRILRFNDLEPLQRARLVAGLKGEAALLKDEAMPGGCFGYTGLVLTPLALWWLWTLDFGDPAQPGLLHAPWALGLYATLIAGLGFGILALLRAKARETCQPLPQGTFITAVDALRIRGDRIEVFPLDRADELTRTYIHQRQRLDRVSLTLKFGRKLLSAPLGEPDEALGRWDALKLAQARYRTALAQGDQQTLAALDPLLDPALVPHGADPAGKAPVDQPLPALLRPGWLTAPVWIAAFLLAYPLLNLRNHRSDEAAYQKALAQGTVKALHDYASHGRLHAQQALEQDLPEAALDEARAKMDLERRTALWQVVDTYPQARARALADLKAMLRREKEAWMDPATPAALKGSDPAWHGAFGRLFDYLLSQPEPRMLVRFNAPGLASWVRRQGEAMPTLAEDLAPLAPDHADANSWKSVAAAQVKQALDGVLGYDLVKIQTENWREALPATREATLDVVMEAAPNRAHAEGRHGDTLLRIIVDFRFRLTLHQPGAAPLTLVWSAPHREQPQGDPMRSVREGMVRDALVAAGMGYPYPHKGPQHPLYSAMAEDAFLALRGELDKRWGR